ncbi:MAG TPA: hypothetical protein VFR59_11500, partial [Steroidobacteraceae bacterium]|nr:hypothetical protein [Steroidobacteraceae bacterium]
MREPEMRLRRCIGVALGLIGTIAAAQDNPQESEASRAAVGTLDEVIVTGTKRAEESQDVPISISAISSDVLERASQNDVRALGSLAPGLVLSNPAGFNATGGGMRGT